MTKPIKDMSLSEVNRELGKLDSFKGIVTPDFLEAVEGALKKRLKKLEGQA